MDLPALHPLLLPEQQLLLEYLGWILQHGGVSFTGCDPEFSHPLASYCTETLVPTADSENRLAAMDEPQQEKGMEGVIALEPIPQTVSDQVRVPATSCIAEGILVETDSLKESPGGYLKALMDSFEEDLIDWFGEVKPKVPVSPAPPVSECPSSFPLPPPQTASSSVPQSLVSFTLCTALQPYGNCIY